MTIDYRLFQALKQIFKLTDDEAKVLTEAITDVSATKVESEYKSVLKHDLEMLEQKIDGRIKKHIYTIGLIQFLAIVATIIAIMSFMITNLRPQ